MARIVWSKDEQSKLQREMVNLLLEEPNLSTRDVLSRCQLILPIERRREVTYNMVFNYKYKVAKAETEANHRRIRKVELTPQPEPVKPKDISTADLIDQLMRRFASMVADEVLRKNPPAFHLSTKPKEEVVHAEAPPITKPEVWKETGILVIGLNGHQMSQIRTRFPKRDIMFISAEEARTRNPVKRDRTILMTKFISHCVQDKYRHAPNLTYCNGGITDLTSILNRIPSVQI